MSPGSVASRVVLRGGGRLSGGIRVVRLRVALVTVLRLILSILTVFIPARVYGGGHV